MAAYAALGVVFLLFVMMGARWYANANPATLVQVLKWSAVGLVGVAGGYLALTGRFGWALFAAPVLVPLYRRARQAFGSGPFGRTAPFEGIGSPGQTSEVRTHYLRMVLDHDSGEMNGEVLTGLFAGRSLRALSLVDLIALLGEARGDIDTVQVLSAYLDRVYGDIWRDRASSVKTGESARASTARTSSAMTRDEAFDVLGLSPGADAATIKATHHRLMSKIHPDLGGSTYLAAKINQAKDVLLGS